MKLISWNVNGIRACVQKACFFPFLETHAPDVLFLQETKIQPEQLSFDLQHPTGYHSVWHSAEKPGYSSVALFSKSKPKFIYEGFGDHKFDREGRVIGAEYENDIVVFGVYFPNGQRDDERLQYKLDFYQSFFAFCEELKKEGKKIIVCGDYNTAHKAIDLARPKENENESGFLPIERAWIDKLVDEMGYVDTFRAFHDEPDQYTWWSFRTASRKRNIGWRIDYFFAHQSAMTHVKEAFILNDVLGSDHCPVGITLAL